MNARPESLDELFRNDALRSKQSQYLGEIIIATPVSFVALAWVSSFLAALLAALLFFGSYTKRSTVGGQLVVSVGHVKVYSSHSGVISRSYVVNGQPVRKGDSLFLVSRELLSGEAKAVKSEVIRQIKRRRDSLNEELMRLKKVHIETQKSMTSGVENLRNEVVSLQSQIQAQNELRQLADHRMGRYKELYNKGYISLDESRQRETESLALRQAHQRLLREEAILKQQLTDYVHKLSSLPIIQTAECQRIERSISDTDQELIEAQGQMTYTIHAPLDGVVVNVMVEEGQAIEPTRLLASTMPLKPDLQVELYLPSKAIGFTKVGDTVMVRYQAYPYQKFGQHKGIVKSISNAAMMPSELVANVGGIPNVYTSGEQMYRLQVSLEDQVLVASGEVRSLQPGMLVEADILHDTRKLYEWVFEPLYSQTKNYKGRTIL